MWLSPFGQCYQVSKFQNFDITIAIVTAWPAQFYILTTSISIKGQQKYIDF